MNERALLALLAAIIWSNEREALQAEADADGNCNGPDDGAIAEAVSYAGDILVEVDEYLKDPDKEYMKEPRESRVIDAEIVEMEPVRRRR